MTDVLRITCFKWYDANYRWNKIYAHDALHVNRLRNMVDRHTTIPHEFCCITDDAEGIDQDIRIIPLWDDHKDMGGCYRRIKMYSAEMIDIIGPRFINFDIDVVICGDLDPMLSRTEPFIAWKDVAYQRQAFNGSMIMMDAGSQSKVWDTFDPELASTLWSSGKGIGTDQAWAYHVLGRDVPLWDQSDGVYSFRRHIEPLVGDNGVAKLPSNATVIVFHGAHSPAMKRYYPMHPWIVEHWR